MILVKVGLQHIFKSVCALALIATCLTTFCLSYAYVSGDRVDREEMQQTAHHFAGYLRLVPIAEASNEENRRDVASENR